MSASVYCCLSLLIITSVHAGAEGSFHDHDLRLRSYQIPLPTSFVVDNIIDTVYTGRLSVIIRTIRRLLEMCITVLLMISGGSGRYKAVNDE